MCSTELLLYASMRNKYHFFFAGKSVKPNVHLDLFKVFLHSTSVYTFLIPFVVFIVVLLEPNIPPFIGWWITYFQIESSTLLLKLITSLITFANLLSLIATGNVVGVYGAYQKLFALLSDLQQLRMFRKSLKWKIIIHKQLSIISKLLNECYHCIIFTWVMFLLYVMVSVDLFVFVRFHSMISVPSAMFVGLTSLEGFIGVFLFNTIAGRIYHLSRKMPDEWVKRNDQVYMDKRMRRQLKSCLGIKIRIGSVNFVDRLTPFVVSGICLKITVRLLVASRN
jgi:hypothetical protein